MISVAFYTGITVQNPSCLLPWMRLVIGRVWQNIRISSVIQGALRVKEYSLLRIIVCYAFI